MDSDDTYCSEIEKENIHKHKNVSNIRSSKRIEQKKSKKRYKFKYVAPKKKKKILSKGVKSIFIKKKLGKWRDIVFSYVAGKKDIQLHEAESIVRSLNKMHIKKCDPDIRQVWEKLNVQMVDIVCEKKLCDLSNINIASQNASPEHEILSKSLRVPSKRKALSEVKAIDNIQKLVAETLPEYHVQDEIVSQDSNLTQKDIFNSNIQKIIQAEHSYLSIKNTEPRKFHEQISDPGISVSSPDLLDNLAKNNEKLISPSPVIIHTISDDEDNTNLITSSPSSLLFMQSAQTQQWLERLQNHNSIMTSKSSDERREENNEKGATNSKITDSEMQNAKDNGWMDKSQIHHSKEMKTKKLQKQKVLSFGKENISKPICQVVDTEYKNSRCNKWINEIHDHNYIQTFNENLSNTKVILNHNNTNLKECFVNPELQNLPSDDCINSSQIIDYENTLVRNIIIPIKLSEKLQNSQKNVMDTLKTFKIKHLQKNPLSFYNPIIINPQVIVNEKQQKSQDSEGLNSSYKYDKSFVQSDTCITQLTSKDFLKNSQSEHWKNVSHVDKAAKPLNVLNCIKPGPFSHKTALMDNCKNIETHITETEEFIGDSQDYVIKKHFPKVLKAQNVVIEYAPARNDAQNGNIPKLNLNLIKPRTEFVQTFPENCNTIPETEMINDYGSSFLSENFNSEPNLHKNVVNKSFDWLKNISKIRKIHSDQCILKEHYPPEFWNNPNAELPKEWKNDFESW